MEFGRERILHGKQGFNAMIYDLFLIQYCRTIPFLRYLDPDPLLLAVPALELNAPLNKKFHALNQAIAQLVWSLNDTALHMTSRLAM